MSQTKAQLLDGKASSIQFSTGSASSPTVSFTGDANTGIYSPGADQLAISTNGSGRLFVDANGNVGVGTNSPSAQFHVRDSANYNFTVVAGNSTTGMQIGNYDATDGYNPLTFRGSQYLFVSTGGNERARIDSSGRLGLGTSSPGNTLHVNSGAVGTSTLLESTGSGSYLGIKNSSGQWTLGATTTSFILENSGGTALTVDSSRRVGIGSNAPVAPLTVSGGISATFGSSPLVVVGGGAASGYYHQIGFGYTDGTYTTPPSAIGFVTQSATAGTYGDLVFGTRSVTTNTAPSERCRLTSDGKFLVGTSTSRAVSGVQWNQQIEGTGDVGFSIVSNATSNTGYINLARSRGTSVGSNTAVIQDDALGVILFSGANGTDLSNNAASIVAYVDGTPFSSGDTTDLPGRLVFSTTADGASSPTERMRIKSDGELATLTGSGNGHQFSTSLVAGASANLITGRHSGSSVGGGTGCFLVRTNGDVLNTNNSYTAISDIKLKENIVDAKSQWDDLKALRVVNYNLKPETGAETFKQLGLIAQEVETVCPGLVGETPDRDNEGNDLGTVTKSVNYSVLYMKAVKALQEAIERIEQLEAKVTALESK